MAKLESRNLGTTGLTVTRLAAGGHFTNGPLSHNDIPRRVRELNHLLDGGVTYIDVQWEPEAQATAEVMRARRDDFAVAWPLHGVSKLGGDVTAQYVVDYCNEDRRKFGIEHVDVLLWIGLVLEQATEEKVLDEVRAGFATLKADGFCDHLGFSCHCSPEMALHAMTRFDDFAVVMVPYCPLHPAAGRELLPTAKAKGIGTVAMKPFGGGTGFFNKVWAGEVDLPAVRPWKNSPRPYQTAIRWVLKDDNLDCTVPGAHSVEQIDDLFDAVAEPFSDADEAVGGAMKAAMDESGAEVPLRSDLASAPDAWD